MIVTLAHLLLSDREVETQLRARRKEARAAVLSRFDADQAAARAGPAWEEGVLGDGDAGQEPPPAPVHDEPHPGAVPGARLEHVMELWNFLQVCRAKRVASLPCIAVLMSSCMSSTVDQFVVVVAAP